MQVLHRIGKFFIFENLLISFAAACLSLQTAVELHQPLIIYPFAIVFFLGTLAEYSFHRFLSDKEREGAILSGNKKKIHLFIAVSSGVGALAACFSLSIEQVSWLFVFAGITLLYSVPFKSGRFKRLRDIPFLKIFLIAIVWSGSTVVIPALQFQDHLTIDSLYLIIQRFLFLMAITIPFDVRDYASDLKNKVKTLAHLFSEKKAYLLATFFTFFYLMCFIIGYWLSLKNLAQLWAGVAGGVIVMFLLNMNRFKKSIYYHQGWLDGSMIIQFGLFILAEYFV